MFKLMPTQGNQGFTLTEVLVAILITSVFVATAMQAVVIAAVMRVKAKQYAEATTWIQQDLEDVKFQASQYNKDSSGNVVDKDVHFKRCSPTNSEDGYADGLGDKLSNRSETYGDTDTSLSDTYEITKSSSTGSQYNFKRTLTPSDIPPYNVLQVKYEVIPANGNPSIAALYTEVIPDAAFKCP